MGTYQPDADIVRAVRAYIEANRSEILEDLKGLVRIPSTRGEAEEHMPFGPGPAQALEAAAALFERQGLSAVRRPDRGYALVRAGGADSRDIGVFCHCDVVFPNGTWLFAQPFEPIERDGYLVGRGVKDNKGSVITTLHALAALKSAGVALRHGVTVFLGSNEETGMADVKSFAAHELMPAISLVPDCEYPVCRGEKSYFHYEAGCDRPFENILDFNSGSARGTVCGEMHVVLRPVPGLAGELNAAVAGRSDAVLSRDGDGNLVLDTKGAAVHASTPKRGVHAGGIAAEILLACPSLGENDLGILANVRPILTECLGGPFGITCRDDDFKDLTTVVTVVTMEGGCLQFSGSINHSPRQDADALWAAMAKTFAAIGWHSEKRVDADSHGFLHEGEDLKIIDMLNDIYLDLHGAQDMRVYVTYGGTYARMLRNAYAVGIEVPFTARPEDYPAGHGMVHQPDECISIEALFNGVEMLAMMLLALDETLE